MSNFINATTVPNTTELLDSYCILTPSKEINGIKVWTKFSIQELKNKLNNTVSSDFEIPYLLITKHLMMIHYNFKHLKLI